MVSRPLGAREVEETLFTAHGGLTLVTLGVEGVDGASGGWGADPEAVRFLPVVRVEVDRVGVEMGVRGGGVPFRMI